MRFPPLIIVDDKQKWVHVSIPKCACSSIRCALQLHFGQEPVKTWQEVHDRKWPQTRTLKWLSQCGPEWHTWAVIRNPFDRLVSVWQEKCCNPAIKDNIGVQLRPLSGQSFEVFCRVICDLIQAAPEDHLIDTHVRPMTHSLVYEGKCVVQEICEMHKLDDYWRGLQGRYGFPALEHLNVSKHETSDKYYTPELRSLVEETYADDLRLWWG